MSNKVYTARKQIRRVELVGGIDNTHGKYLHSLETSEEMYNIRFCM